MPAYNAKNPPPALGTAYPLNQETVFNNEAIPVNTYSQQVHLISSPTGAAKGISIDGDFNAAPGTFEIDVYEADFDGGIGEYTPVASGSITTVTSPSATHFHLNIQPVTSQFFLLFVKTAPSNANIKVTARITRA